MLSEILRYLVPASEFSYVGEPTTETEYQENVTWQDQRPQPSWAQVQAAKPAVELALIANAVASERHAAYVVEADPLFFGWQRGENTEQAWLDKVAEIRARFPYAE